MQEIDINCEILVWARKTAGLSQEEATKKLGINDAYGKTAIERLSDLENGNSKPTRAMLVKMAKYYRRSLLTFYLEKPPKKGNRGQDFRTLPLDYSPKNDTLLDALVRNIKARQHLVRAILEDEEVEEIPFISSQNIETAKIEDVIKSIQHSLKIDIAEYRKQKTALDAFELLRNKVEAAGIFVLLIGNLGSHHSNIPPSVFRGFADADPIAPFIVINDQDAKTAWSFTLLHELAHLWLGESGVSNNYDELKIERFCNKVAGGILLPKNEIQDLKIPKYLKVKELKNIISDFASKRHLSRSMVAYNLYINNKISKSLWQNLEDIFSREWKNNRDEQKKRNKEKEGGPNYYVVYRHRVGKALIKFVSRTINEGILTPTKAAKILGVKPRNVDFLIHPFNYEGVR